MQYSAVIKEISLPAGELAIGTIFPTVVSIISICFLAVFPAVIIRRIAVIKQDESSSKQALTTVYFIAWCVLSLLTVQVLKTVLFSITYAYHGDLPQSLLLSFDIRANIHLNYVCALFAEMARTLTTVVCFMRVEEMVLPTKGIEQKPMELKFISTHLIFLLRIISPLFLLSASIQYLITRDTSYFIWQVRIVHNVIRRIHVYLRDIDSIHSIVKSTTGRPNHTHQQDCAIFKHDNDCNNGLLRINRVSDDYYSAIWRIYAN